MYLRKPLLIAAAVSAMLVLAACGDATEEEAPEEGQTSAEQTMAEDTAMTEETTAMEEETDATVGAGEVTVGGFTVESPGVPASEIPEAAASQEAVNEYLGEIRPVIDGTVRDISGLVDPEVEIGDDGSISIDPNFSSLDEARQSVEDGATELQNIDAPEELAPINDRLVEAYEEALPAYQNVAEAAQSGDPGQFATATQESLPQIQAFNTEVNAIIEDLEQAGG